MTIIRREKLCEVMLLPSVLNLPQMSPAVPERTLERRKSAGWSMNGGCVQVRFPLWIMGKEAL